jgi:hypothetical protein
LKDAGIDPNAADMLHRQRMVGQDFQKTLIRSAAPDGSSINIDRLPTQANNLRYSKYGDRLSQQEVQQQGVHALEAQGVAKMLGQIGLGGVGHAASVLMGH